jgi:hypothetical protein
MDITFIIGNGFDLNLGLPTDYNHFYRYYSNLHSKDENVKKLKENITQYIDKDWRDLELGLGKYTSSVNNTQVFQDVYLDMQENLSNYLKLVDKSLLPSSEELKKQLMRDFVSPENHLNNKEKDYIVSFKNNYSNNNPWNLHIINFNYTHTIENILKLKDKEQIGQQFSRPVLYNGVDHIHRTLDDNGIWIGVNDESQIENVSFRKELLIQCLLIKPFMVSQSGNNEEIKCANIIANSSLICIFGSSLGETDEYWLNKIATRLTSSDGCRLIYFTISQEKYSTDQLYLYQKQIIKNKLLQRLGIPGDKMQSVQNRVYIAINSFIFKDKDYYEAIEENYYKIVPQEGA